MCVCVCVCVCMYVRMYVYMCIRMYTYVCVCMCAHVCAYRYVYVYVCTYVCNHCICVENSSVFIICLLVLPVAAAVRDLRNDAVPFMAGVVRHITMVAVVQQCSKYIQ